MCMGKKLLLWTFIVLLAIRAIFLTTAFAKLAEWGVKTLFIGDCNCQLCPIIDKFPTGKPILGSLWRLWLCRYLEGLEYTFFSRVHSCYTRIDYLFSSKNMLQHIMSCHIGNISISDQYSFGNQNTKSNSWRFHPFIMADHNFISYFTEEFNSFMSINSSSTEDPSL